ncbi:Nucleotide-binding, alpha-beta plait [Moelleriella libera RCEF 2490]|uniref:U4/U6 snRNA-associated-splicing factor PRP24 n=1 Tax=Moelleriella libera RCEF 2490 TaxID=1081109 RepID=A0A168ATQ9_9HYPO|nr:Nucleotide-binding, alpha-beta plait [Moelleriella libera RCEF 2490]
MNNPVGEESWIAYLEEQARDAVELEQHVKIVELYQAAVSAEPGSLRLWIAYCSFFQSLGEKSRSSDTTWTEEEQLMGQELFSTATILELWELGYYSVQYRLSDSHELWNRWISLEREHFVNDQTSDGLSRITQLYRDRLVTPHVAWEDTSQSFSSFLSEYNQNAWEEEMKNVTAGAQSTKRAIEARDPFETKLKQAQRSADVELQKSLLRDYLDWELQGTKGRNSANPVSRNLCSGLFDRALTGLFAEDDEVWHDYVVFVSPDRAVNTAQRAVEHCPWSGRLWNRYILCAEEAQSSLQDVEAIKDLALKKDQLCRDGMENMLEMYAAWCAFLKRKSLAEVSDDVDDDAVTSGLKAAIAEVMATGKKLYGREFRGDPKYRLERILVQYLTEKKQAVSEARVVWNQLARNRIYADAYEFWFDYYTWEMFIFSQGEGGETPVAATAALCTAAMRETIDWPEKVLDLYLQHCTLYETCNVVRRAQDHVHETQKILQKRRKREEAARAAQYAAYQEAQLQETQSRVETQQQEQASAVDIAESPSAQKRKRDEVQNEDQTEGDEQSGKRPRNGESITDPTASAQPPKRDREHSTVLVTNLPLKADQPEVKRYFRPYGQIKNITAFVKDEQRDCATALIEFSSAEEAQSALLRDAKYFGESQIKVELGHDLTVYVANFPPSADEQFIRSLFKDCGEILSIRWPSLQVNTHRRFCYVSFLDRGAAAKAVAKEGKLLEGKYRLLAKYSDPNRKKNREGATAEGREVHVSNLDRSATEAELREVFAKFGTVVRVNIPQNVAGRSRGFAFVDFETRDEAATAAQELNNTKFRSQILGVQISKETKVKPTAKSSDAKQPPASSPAPAAQDTVMGEGGSEDNPAPAGPSASEIAARTIALMGLPDTVNDARVRALVEPLGSVIKLVHQPSHGGAIIEFADAVTAGKAALQLDSMQYEGHQLRTGTPDELRQNKPDNHHHHNNNNNSNNNNRKKTAASVDSQINAKPKASSALMLPPPTVRRRGPKRALGLAPRKVAAAPPASTSASASAASAEDGTAPTEAGAGAAGAPKSNADFKAMFLAGKQTGAAINEDK